VFLGINTGYPSKKLPSVTYELVKDSEHIRHVNSTSHHNFFLFFLFFKKEILRDIFKKNSKMWKIIQYLSSTELLYLYIAIVLFYVYLYIIIKSVY